jgi:hypothetical protein
MMICPRIIDVQKRAERNLEVWRSCWIGSPDPVYTLGTFAQHHCTTE